MKRTLALMLVAISSAALAQTAAKTPAGKPSATSVKVVAVPAQKPAVVAAKPASAQPATVKAVAVSAAHATASASAKPVAVAVSAHVAAPAAHPVAVSAKPVAVPVSHVSVVSGKPVNAPKMMVAPVKADPFKSAGKHEVPAKVGSKVVAVAATSKSSSPAPVAVQDTKSIADAKDKETKPISTANKRDPFVSPVVTMGATGSGCSSGKRCLAIDQVALRGVVKSDDGMIAVVVNSADKAYFLRENDPVFDGYVLKITGDSVVFKETFHDKLGKPLTKDVTKTISRPAV